MQVNRFIQADRSGKHPNRDKYNTRPLGKSQIRVSDNDVFAFSVGLLSNRADMGEFQQLLAFTFFLRHEQWSHNFDWFFHVSNFQNCK